MEQVGMGIMQTQRADCLRLEHRDGGFEGVVATGLDPPSRGWGQVQERGALTMMKTSHSWQVLIQRGASVPPAQGAKMTSAKAMASSPLGGGGRGARQPARDRQWTAGRTSRSREDTEKRETSF